MKRSPKTHHRLRPSVRLLIGAIAELAAFALAFALAASGALDASEAAAQSKRKPARSSAAPGEPGPGGLPLRTFQFETVTLNSSGAITDRKKAHARYYVEHINGGALEMVEIPAGSYQMGISKSEFANVRKEGQRLKLSDDVSRWEMPQHTVAVPSFYMSKYEVTQAQWRAVATLPRMRRLNPDPSEFKGDNLPVERVSWDDAVEFCARLSKATGRNYRLPTEAEWEYGCRAGTTTPFPFGETITPELVNYNGDHSYGSAAKGMFRKQTTPVGSLGAANGFGLYDMLGNVTEWCLDYWHESYAGAPTDGSAWIDGTDKGQRVVRGGDWVFAAYSCRSAYRNYAVRSWPGGFGFRVVEDPHAPIAGSKGERPQSGPSGAAPADFGLKHDWRVIEGPDTINYASNHPAPVPFSMTGEPEATLAMDEVPISGKARSLSE